MRFEPEIVTALQHLKWWDYDARKMTGLVPDLPIEEFVEWFTDRKQSNEFSLYKPRTFEI
ncbi:hypothetical protein JCM19232_2218 [Vibrio ishigakensis]|uniref:Uncharacterized protein n=1 Tax=Vibrio ishigakensis TaxID=1481914 RepID=A0A0B8PL05_9VIBR|nr:hypothetical protein JCM19232_2218 [Vibrio ishigakensis]